MSHLCTIAILGPESSGKSTLCEQLATHLNSVWVREYAREYVPTRAGKYDKADLLAILDGQNNLIRTGIHAAQQGGASYLITDTEAIVLAVWAQAALGYVPPEIERACAAQSFTNYLLLAPDLPWQADPLRSAPELAQRQAIFAQYEIWLARYQRPYTVISGHNAARLHNALRALSLPILHG